MFPHQLEHVGNISRINDLFVSTGALWKTSRLSIRLRTVSDSSQTD